MNQFPGMQIVHGLGHLIDNKPLMLLFQNILPDQRVQINIHELKDQIYVALILGFDDFL